MQTNLGKRLEHVYSRIFFLIQGKVIIIIIIGIITFRTIFFVLFRMQDLLFKYKSPEYSSAKKTKYQYEYQFYFHNNV